MTTGVRHPAAGPVMIGCLSSVDAAGVRKLELACHGRTADEDRLARERDLDFERNIAPEPSAQSLPRYRPPVRTGVHAKTRGVRLPIAHCA